MSHAMMAPSDDYSLGVTREAQSNCAWEAVQIVLPVTAFIDGVIQQQDWYGFVLQTTSTCDSLMLHELFNVVFNLLASCRRGGEVENWWVAAMC